MPTRITGYNSGLDVDALVKAALTNQRTRIDKETQNKKILEYQQEQYKQIMSDASGFYDKYFDILKTGNFMSTSTYSTVSFTPSDSSKVTAKGFAGASVENYTVNVTQLAAKASIALPDGETGNQTMTFGSGDNSVTLDDFVISNDGSKTAKENAAITISNYNTKLTAKKTALTNTLNATTDTAEKLKIQQQLKSLNVTATYSEFNKAIVFTADQMGEGGFTLNDNSAIDKEIQGTITKGGASYTLSGTSNTVTVDNVQFSFKAPTIKSTTTNLTHLTDLTDLTNLTDLTDLDVANGGTITDGTKTTTKSADGNTITTTDGTTTTTTIINGTTTTKTTIDNGITTTTTIKDGITTEIETTDGTKTTTTSGGTITTTDGTKTTTSSGGTITTTDGAKTTTTSGGTKTTIQTGTDGEVTKTVTINGGTPVTTIDTPVSLTGATDVTALKDKIISFVNDYNTLIQSMNTKLYETRDKDYMPLTDDQKEAMTEDQITAWEKKVQTGLLRRDSDLERITSEMKSAMSSVMSGSGLYLESIGINPVKNYTDKNGTFTVDESKLTQALENNAEGVKDLFIRDSSTTDKGGVLTQLKSALYSEFKTSTSSLAKKVGLVGSSTEYNNTLANNIYKKKLLIADLNSSLSDKEDALYKKYSNLETALQTLNSQQSSLTSMLGMG
jgi:flagellar hook-associated protein 2